MGFAILAPWPTTGTQKKTQKKHTHKKKQHTHTHNTTHNTTQLGAAGDPGHIDSPRIFNFCEIELSSPCRGAPSQPPPNPQRVGGRRKVQGTLISPRIFVFL